MPAIINGQVTYSGGEALPTVGSAAYNQAASGVIPTASSGAVNPFLATPQNVPVTTTPLKSVSSPANQAIPQGTVTTASAAQTATDANTAKFNGVINSMNTGVVTPSTAAPAQAQAPAKPVDTSIPAPSYNNADGTAKQSYGAGDPLPSVGSTAYQASINAIKNSAASSIPPADSQSFQAANPGEDLAHYNAAGGLQAPDLTAANTQISTEAQSHITALENMKATSDVTSQALLSSIQAQFSLRAQNIMAQNAAAVGGVNTSGLVSGRTQYASEIQTGLLSAEETAGMQRLNQNTADMVSATVQAQQAMDDKDFKYLNAISDTYDKAVADQKQTLQQMFTNSMSVANYNLQAKQQSASQANDQLKLLSSVNPKNISPTQLSQLDSSLGMPAGFTAQYLKASSAAATAKTAKEQVDANKAYTDLLQSVPAGKTIPLPDGSTITGIGKADDISTFEKEDSGGKVTVVAFNKSTGSLKEYSAGNIGTPNKSAGGTSEGSTAVKLATAVAPFQNAAKSIAASAKNNGDYVTSSGKKSNVADAAVEGYKSFITDYPGNGKWYIDNVLPQYGEVASNLAAKRIKATQGIDPKNTNNDQ